VEGGTPGRTARIMDEGVYALGTVALPHREFLNPPPHHLVETAGKHSFPLTHQDNMHLDAAKTLLSESAQLAAEAKVRVPTRTVEEMVPVEYHLFLPIFIKKHVQQLPPRQ
jgi:hypothetical protein